ncbi:MAG: hypothetical protein WBG01_02525 [Bacteroidota bacterium]
MDTENRRMLLIKIAYWLGIVVDGLWAVALFHPPLFAVLTGNPEFDPDISVRPIMAIGGILMVSMTTSYVLSGKIRSQAEPSNHPRLRRFTVSKASLCPLDFAIETRHIVTTY